MTTNKLGLVREAGHGDAESIAELHIHSWRETYQDILPADYLRHTIVKERHAYWRQLLTGSDPGDFVLMIPDETAVLAFICVLRNRESGYDALIDNLHVHSDCKGQGFGRMLMEIAVNRLIDAGAQSLCLWVFDSNRQAVRFYERLGARADQHGVDGFAGAHAPHTRLAWQDLVRLRENCS